MNVKINPKVPFMIGCSKKVEFASWDWNRWFRERKNNVMRNIVNCLSVEQMIVFRTFLSFIREMINGEVLEYSTEKIKI